MTLEEKIAARHAQVGVIGLGYVGLPLVIDPCIPVVDTWNLVKGDRPHLRRA